MLLKIVERQIFKEFTGWFCGGSLENCLLFDGSVKMPQLYVNWSLVMTYVVSESCIKCKFTDCVDVCPVDCFREGPNFLVIDPDECIDCTLCVAECPVEAIYAEDDLPEDQRHFTALNAELSKLWEPIVEKKDAPADADDWMNVKEKLHLLER